MELGFNIACYQELDYVKSVSPSALRGRSCRQHRHPAGSAALGPAAVGGLHDVTGGWSVPLLAVLTSLTVLIASGLVATRHIRAASAAPVAT